MVDYQEVLEDLKRRRADIQHEFHDRLQPIQDAIVGIEKLLRTSGPQDQIPGLGPVETMYPFRTLTIRAAARECLLSAGEPLKTRDLAEQIRKGGFPSDSENFTTTVYGVLNRIHKEFRVSDGWWSLAEWPEEKPP